jgi:hypothetical protein
VKNLFIKIFSHIRPFALEYERMDGTMFIIGIRYNKFEKMGVVGFVNSFGFFYGYKYKSLQWLSAK